MAKIALIYSGQPRHLIECHDNHVKTFYEANPDSQIDVFAHIWYDEKQVGNYFWDQYKNRGRWEANLKEIMEERWHPKSIVYEEPRGFICEDIEPDSRFPHPINNILSMFYSIEQANNLKKQYEDENTFKYDCVIRLRTDEYFTSPIGSLENYDMNVINVLNERAHLDYGINDHFAFGSSELMDKYSDVYSNFIEICKMGAAVNPECLVGFNAQIRHKLPIVKNNWHYKLWRDV